MTVQLFFAWRIWVLSKSVILSGLIVSVAITQGLCAMYSGIKVSGLSGVQHNTKLNIAQFAILNDITKIASLFPTATVWLGGSALCDFIITIAMVTFVRFPYIVLFVHHAYSNTCYSTACERIHWV